MKKIKIGFIVSLFIFGSLFGAIDTIEAEENTNGLSDSYVLDTSTENNISYEDMIDEIAQYNDKSVEEVNNEFVLDEINKITTTNSEILRYRSISDLRTTANVNLRARQYKYNKWRLDVDAWYKPQLVIYFEAETSNRTAVEILNVSMNRANKGTGSSKQFSGSIYYKLENPTTLNVEINGDFFNNGTTTISGGGSIGLSEFAKIEFSVSYSSNFYEYFYKQKRYPIVVNACIVDDDYLC